MIGKIISGFIIVVIISFLVYLLYKQIEKDRNQFKDPRNDWDFLGFIDRTFGKPYDNRAEIPKGYTLPSWADRRKFK
jgi:hypothetical protein